MEIENSMIKIRLCAGWDNSHNITSRLLNQFVHTIRSDIEFVFDNSYNLIIYNNYITEKTRCGASAALFFHEPSWSGNHQKVFNVDDNITVYGYDPKIYQNCKTFKQSFSHMFYGGAGSWREGNEFWTYNNLLNKRFVKSKNISCITSSIGSKQNECIQGSNYYNRLKCIQSLNNNLSDKIDFYGSSVSNHLSLKKDGLIDYKFSICIENTYENNYISEKFYDAILTDTIPIYFGCKNIKDIWPEKGYILLESITDINYLQKELLSIISHSDSIYREKIQGCLDIKSEFLTQNNLYQKILKHIEDI